MNTMSPINSDFMDMLVFLYYFYIMYIFMIEVEINSLAGRRVKDVTLDWTASM